MANFNEKTGFIELTEEDKETMENGVGKNWAKNIINKIIWGDKEYFYENI